MADPASPECPIGGNGPVSEKWPAQKHQRCIGPYGSPCVAFRVLVPEVWRQPCVALARERRDNGDVIARAHRHSQVGRVAARMCRRKPRRMRAVLRRSAQRTDRSSLFWWMVEHHDELKTTASGRRLQWAALCTRFAELSLTDINGKPASPRTARETWLRARRAVEEANRRLAAKPPARVGAVYPSRIPKEWRPTVVPPMRRRRPAGAGIPGARGEAGGAGARAERRTPRSPKRKKPASKPRSTRCASSFARRTGTSIRFHPKEESRLMPDGQIRPADRPPILWIALGRQRVGKTVLLNTAVQYFRGLGNPLRVWNADQQNRSHTLSLFFPDAEEVTGSGIEDGMAWTEARIVHQIAHGYDAVLDVGGGATGFAKLVQEVPLLDALDSSSLLVVGLFCTGPERADLDYLEQFAHADMFMPPASLVVFNSGLVLSGRSTERRVRADHGGARGQAGAQPGGAGRGDAGAHLHGAGDGPRADVRGGDERGRQRRVGSAVPVRSRTGEPLVVSRRAAVLRGVPVGMAAASPRKEREPAAAFLRR